MCRDGLHRLLGRHAQPLEPDVDLDEHVARSGRPPPAYARAPSRSTSVRREPVSEALRRGLGQRVRIDEDGAGDPAPAKRIALARSATASASAPFAANTRADLGGAVAVAVGLDHGEDLPVRAHHLAHGADVGRAASRSTSSVVG
jgi:hypothetical protein